MYARKQSVGSHSTGIKSDRVLNNLDDLMQSISDDFGDSGTASENLRGADDDILGFYGAGGDESVAPPAMRRGVVNGREIPSAVTVSPIAAAAPLGPQAPRPRSRTSTNTTMYVSLSKLQQSQFTMSSYLLKHNPSTAKWQSGFFVLGEDAVLYQYNNDTALDVGASAVLPITSVFGFQDQSDYHFVIKMSNEFKQLAWSLKFTEEGTYDFWLKSLNRMLANQNIVANNANWRGSNRPQQPSPQPSLMIPQQPNTMSFLMPQSPNSIRSNSPAAPSLFMRSNSISSQASALPYIPPPATSRTYSTRSNSVSQLSRSGSVSQQGAYVPGPSPRMNRTPSQNPSLMSYQFPHPSSSSPVNMQRGNSQTQIQPRMGPTIEQKMALQAAMQQQQQQQMYGNGNQVDMMLQKSRQIEFAEMDRQYKANQTKQQEAAVKDAKKKADKLKASMGLI